VAPRRHFYTKKHEPTAEREPMASN
jgi:hypothetical protein